jgi:acetyl/propionyl-CoA carboxylase alpha subunit
MTPKKLLIANRGEIAIRVTEAAAELGLTTVAIFSEDDAKSLHVIRADEACQLRGAGAAAYLDGEQIVAAAKQAGCNAIHPGYVDQRMPIRQTMLKQGASSWGRAPNYSNCLATRLRSCQVASQCRVPVLAGSVGPTSLEEVQSFCTLPCGRRDCY